MRYKTLALVQKQLFEQYQHMMDRAADNEANFDAADELAQLLHTAGYAAQVRTEVDADEVTLVVFTNVPPARMPDLELHGIDVNMIDFHDSEHHITGTYRVIFHGVELSVVAHGQRPEMRAAA